MNTVYNIEDGIRTSFSLQLQGFFIIIMFSIDSNTKIFRTLKLCCNTL